MSWLDRFKKSSTPEPVAPASEPAPAAETPPAAAPVVARPRPRAPAPELPAVEPGECLLATYQVQRRIDGAGWFMAYLASHLAWNVPVVVKAAKTELLGDADALRRVERGAAQWVSLAGHPHVACCYYHLTVNAVPVLVIEAVDGGDLSSWMAGPRGGDLRAALQAALQCCLGLEHVHAHGLVHGAVRPENILIDSRGRAALTDIGIARRARPDRAAYAAPELWGGADGDARSDIFGLGVCLCEMLGGQRPYESTDAGPIAPRVPAASRDGRPFPAEFSALLTRCVAWEPEGRPAGVAEIRTALGSVFRALFQIAAVAAEPPQGSWGADGNNTRAVSEWFLGNPEAADAAWEAALAADPQHAASAYNVALCRWRRGGCSKEDLDALLDAVSPAPARAWQGAYVRAVARLEDGDSAGAESELKELARQVPAAAEVAAALAIARAEALPPGPPLAVLEGTEVYVTCVDCTRDGRTGISGSDDGGLRVWDVASGQCVQVLAGHQGPVSSVRLSADGTLALSGSDDRTMRLWDLASGTCKQVFEIGTGRVFAVALSPDGRVAMLAASTDESVAGIEETNLQSWNLATGRKQRGFEGHTSVVKAVTISSDGRWGVSGSDDHTVRLWDMVSGRCLRVFEGHTHYVSGVRLSLDRQFLVSSSWDGTVRLWDVNKGHCLRVLQGHTNLVTSAVLSDDGRWVLSGSWDKTVKLWSAVTGRCACTFTGHTGLVTSVALSGDARVAMSASWDKTVRVWDVPRKSPFPCPLLRSPVRG